MNDSRPRSRRWPGAAVLIAALIAAVWWTDRTASAGQDAGRMLRIGTSGSIAEEKAGGNEKGAIETLRDFIKDETGFANEIDRQKDWHELADKMAKKQLDIGVFPGFEFAWAGEKHPDLRPLAIAVNVRPYREIYVIKRKDNPASDFAALAGQTAAVPKSSLKEPMLFLEKLCRDNGKDPNQFFAKMTGPNNSEDALDDVVDKVVQAAVVDRVALEAFKRRKPGRFDQLNPVAQSKRLPPTVIAYVDKALDQATLDRFRDGLVNANKKERGQQLLTMFKLTGFDPVPQNFDQTLAETRKEFPAK